MVQHADVIQYDRNLHAKGILLFDIRADRALRISLHHLTWRLNAVYSMSSFLNNHFFFFFFLVNFRLSNALDLIGK